MSDTTPRLALPLIGDHSQKRIVMNEGLMRLESLVQAQVKSRTTAAQPAGPVDGDAYILPAGATGSVWGSLAIGAFVRSESATWETIAFPDGAIVHVADENRLVIRSGSGWAAFEDVVKALDNLTHLGIGATADTTNVLAVTGPAALVSGKYADDGGSGDLSLSLNKESDGNTAQILLQKDFSTRAILGLLGDNDLTVKVSPDGAGFVTALTINGITGGASFDGQLVLADGSNASPTLSFSNGGIYNDADNSGIGISIGGNQAAFIASGLIELSRLGGSSALHVKGEGTTQAGVYRYTNDNAPPENRLLKARGTISSPLVPVTSDRLGAFNFFAYTITGSAGGFTQAAQIQTVLIETGTVTPTAVGSSVRILTAAIGSGTNTETARFEVGTGLSMYGANPVIDQNRNVRARIYTVATLPSATIAGQRAQVSDAGSPVFAAAVTGGGSTHSPVYSDGSTWRCG